MSSDRSILDLAQARSGTAAPDGSAPAITLRLAPAELVVIETADGATAAWLADLCSGLFSLAEGQASFLGHDWAALRHDYAAALRGRIGRVFGVGGWLGFLNAAENILLPQLHHTHEAPASLGTRAVQLACRFGLPGLPLERTDDLPGPDLARTACVRAFLGDPALLLLENPVPVDAPDLAEPLLGALAEARGNGAGAIWLARRDLPGDASLLLQADRRLRLGERGLAVARRGTR